MKLAIRLREGERVPGWLWGYAYSMPWQPIAVFAPIPLNWIIRWARDIWWFLARRQDGVWDRWHRAVFAKGYKAGQRDYRKRLHMMEDSEEMD